MLFAVLSQTSKQLLSNFQPQKPSNYKQLWGLRSSHSCVYKKCTLIFTCFSHTVKQAICYLELASISKTMMAFSKSAKNFWRGNISILLAIRFQSQAYTYTACNLQAITFQSIRYTYTTYDLKAITFQSLRYTYTTHSL